MPISDLNPADPAFNAPVGLGDDETRAVKQALIDSWGGIDGLVTSGTASPAATAADMIGLFDEIVILKQGGGAGAVPLGTIAMWTTANGAAPVGWTECISGTTNGVNVPDLRNRFIVGAGSTYGDGSTGGALPGSQTTDPAGAHTHSTSSFALEMQHLPSNLGDNILISQSATDQSDNHSRAGSFSRGNNDTPGDTSLPVTVTGANSTAHSHGDTGSDGTHTHSLGGASLPPYYALTFIIYVGT